uniref:Uncharacterized protein n=1 Tax=Chromera velia CCMP2878 TaxID=1169474 RepID=A0A0G4FIR4_9ALVE|eukprot:Cvel_17270.t1-p1 / transcript=Cvel_17270.t1 / gene=Cvel_17270 / organism=Chromera_velia_CCMP2878 / gene_product=hypothetical protein / transcript_product=hypothetical protein / location=Cvel_scaffold1369:31578-34078(+) / protein_length=313 / sequence_SO=supercontig / SO=protein_coding / is_pseudo=false
MNNHITAILISGSIPTFWCLDLLIFIAIQLTDPRMEIQPWVLGVAEVGLLAIFGVAIWLTLVKAYKLRDAAVEEITGITDEEVKKRGEPHPLHAVLGSSASSPNTEDLFDFILFVGPGGQSDGRTAPSFLAVQLAQRRVHMGVFAASRWQSDFKIVSGLIELGHFEGTEPQAVELAAVQGNIGLCSSCPPGAIDKHIVSHLDVISWAASSVGISDLTGLGCFERGMGGLNGFSVFLQKVRGLRGRLDRRRKRKSREREGFSSMFELKGRTICPDMDRCVVCKLKGWDKFCTSVMLGLNEATKGLLDCSIHAFC